MGAADALGDAAPAARSRAAGPRHARRDRGVVVWGATSVAIKQVDGLNGLGGGVLPDLARGRAS